MWTRVLALGLTIGIGMAESQATCSPKIFNEDGINSCDFMEGRPDTARMIFTVGLNNPPFNEENTPENLEKLRKWTDTLFLQHDLRFWQSRNQRAQPPSDPMLSWSYSFLYLDRATILAVAERGFVKRISYRSTPPAVTIVRPNRQAIPNWRLGYYEINGRLIIPAYEGTEAAKPHPKNFSHRKYSREAENK